MRFKIIVLENGKCERKIRIQKKSFLVWKKFKAPHYSIDSINNLADNFRMKECEPDTYVEAKKLIEHLSKPKHIVLDCLEIVPAIVGGYYGYVCWNFPVGICTYLYGKTLEECEKRVIDFADSIAQKNTWKVAKEEIIKI